MAHTQFRPLPAGGYAIGVNGLAYVDDAVYRPTFFSDGKPVYLSESGVAGNVDITLPPARTPAQLRVKLSGPDGKPQSGATVTLENLQGVQRWFSREHLDTNGEIQAPVYLGESYLVRAFHFLSGEFQEMVELEGSAQVRLSEQNQSTAIELKRVK